MQLGTLPRVRAQMNGTTNTEQTWYNWLDINSMAISTKAAGTWQLPVTNWVWKREQVTLPMLGLGEEGHPVRCWREGAQRAG